MTATGAVPLARAQARQDVRLLAPWVLIVTAFPASSMVYPLIFPDQADRLALNATVNANPALGLIFGPAYDLSSTDGFAAWRSLALGGFLAGLGAIFALTRLTRAQEDSGQAELLASGVMGRAARLMSAVSLCSAYAMMLWVVAAVSTLVFGGGLNATMLLTATMAATAWMCTGFTAITAQLGADARTANSMAVGTLAILFLLRGFAYSMNAPMWLIWINPLGWMTATKPAVENDWWPLLLALALGALLLMIAFALQGRRDFGVGIVTPAAGPERGKDRSPSRLALRINRGTLATWTIAFLALGVVFGYFTTSIKNLLESNATVTEILAAGATSTGDLIGAFVVTVLSLIGILAAIPGVQTVLKVHAEENADRLEPILATAVSRRRYYAANVALAFAVPAGYVVIAGFIVALLASRAGIGVSFGDVLLQAVATIPAVWTVIAVAVAVVGVKPPVVLGAWAGVLASFALTILGPTFKLWDWVMGFSPFYHVPDVSTGHTGWWGLLWISLVTLLFLAVGFARFSTRDIGYG